MSQVEAVEEVKILTSRKGGDKWGTRHRLPGRQLAANWLITTTLG